MTPERRAEIEAALRAVPLRVEKSYDPEHGWMQFPEPNYPALAALVARLVDEEVRSAGLHVSTEIRWYDEAKKLAANISALRAQVAALGAIAEAVDRYWRASPESDHETHAYLDIQAAWKRHRKAIADPSPALAEWRAMERVCASSQDAINDYDRAGFTSRYVIHELRTALDAPDALAALRAGEGRG